MALQWVADNPPPQGHAVMTELEVIELMESSRSLQEWDRNARAVKAAFGGEYPDFWRPVMLQSGLADAILGRFGATTDTVALGPEGETLVIKHGCGKPTVN
jgi:hypothetical protein